jgi:hypothetical protein
MKKIALLFIFVLIGGAKSQNSNVDYYPLKVGYEWKYKIPDKQFEEKYIVESYDNTYEAYLVKKIVKLGDLSPMTSKQLIEKRNDKVLLLGDLIDGDWKTYSSRVMLESNLKVGKSWKSNRNNADQEIDEYKVVAFTESSVIAGSFKNVIVIEHIITGFNSETKKRQKLMTTREYYAPNVGLIRTDVQNSKNKKFELYSELVEYKTNSESPSK